MTMRAAAAVFAADPTKCYAGCENLDYQDLIVAKCNHMFCRACLDQWLQNKETCPLDQARIAGMTPHNVRQKEEDAELNRKDLDGGMQYTTFKLYLERLIYYVKNDSATLEDKLAAAKATKIAAFELLKAEKESERNASADQCAICFTPFPQMYFIMRDADQTRIGRFMHGDCWKETVDNQSVLLEISACNMVKVAEQLPPPKTLPPEPFKPASPVKVFFIAIILPISIWALAMNNRIYNNKSTMLFMLSIPALIIFKVLSLLLSGIKAILTNKHS